MIEPEKPLKKKNQIKFDEEMANRHAEELQAELEEEERVARQREEETNLISWDNTQAMMEAEYELAQRLQAEEQREFICSYGFSVKGSKSQEEGSKKRTRKELDDESVKRQKLEDDAKKAELKACLKIVLDDDSVVNVKSLATKYPIVDWKTHILAEYKMYYQIIKADGSAKFYKIFNAMLDDFDRQDVLDLYRLVKERLRQQAQKDMTDCFWEIS
ncbi:hypothetical protein Tco_1129936 [Tanacetum coccineum]